MDLEIRKLQKGILDALNGSSVPMECKRLVLLEIIREVETQSNMLINKQMQEEIEKENEDGN